MFAGGGGGKWEEFTFDSIPRRGRGEGHGGGGRSRRPTQKSDRRRSRLSTLKYILSHRKEQEQQCVEEL